MRSIITVTESKSLPGTFTVSAFCPGKNARSSKKTASGHHAAAAVAIEIAMRLPSYTILAPKKVLDCIPHEYIKRQ